ncbi:hypothetical protein ACS0TY_001798 [Phlomoides rotata]
MKDTTDGIQDLIQEAKLRTVWWILCIFAVTYILTHTSKSMLMNIPIAILLVSGVRILLNEVEFHWKVRRSSTSYLSHLERKQLSVNDPLLSTLPPPQEWKKKIDSPVIEAALEDFVSKALNEFVIDMWYADITPDKEAPELIHAIIMDVLSEVSGRIKNVNLADLLTRDTVDMIGDHIDLFRRNQAAIGRDVMGTLSSDERDEKLKHHLMTSKELHPALISPECEYKVIQQLMAGLLAAVLKPTEAQCSLVRCIAREILTCLVMQPIMNFASPAYINELIESMMLAYNDTVGVHDCDHTASGENNSNQGTGVPPSPFNENWELESVASGNSLSTVQDEHMHPRTAEWAKAFDAATQRRTEVLMPENLENMWAIGRNYKKDFHKKTVSDIHVPEAWIQQETRSTDLNLDGLSGSQDLNSNVLPKEVSAINDMENNASLVTHEDRDKLKRSISTSDIEVQSKVESMFTSNSSASLTTESYNADVNKTDVYSLKSNSDMVPHSEVLHAPKLRCRVIGAFFEKLGSNSFAVYSIAVTDTENTTWCVNRRYRNFERLHRHLKDIPNYTLHLPPKRIFSSSTEDSFVHQRCIQLDKYLQDLLSIANVAEQHEVWDFLSASSKNYSFGKSSSVMTTLAVNVDDAMDDIIRQFKGASDGLMRRRVAKSPSFSSEASSFAPSRNTSWNPDDINKLAGRRTISESLHSFSDNEEGDKDAHHGQQEHESSALLNGGHLDNELKDDPTGVPPEWTPPHLSVPVLNLVDNIFQLKRRGWLRRQVFWISKQILQLIMEDAIDDWLLGRINLLRREEVVAQGIRYVHGILWPGGIFFLTLRKQNAIQATQGGKKVGQPSYFEQQLEAARRASDVKKMLLKGAPAPLVSLIGNKQYKRCAKDIYYFLQSTVCLKQLGYGILELVLISLFPELRELVRDIHEKMHMHPSHT